MKSLNIGILAHVDAGKTSLTERLLFNNGVIKTLGSVDTGNTQTDSMALERQRGITIKSAVVSFTVGNLKINLIDTPGHPDFIAEVERALSVLDAVVLVISAVEGVQPQTRVLMRALAKMRIPTLIFVNKVDRMGARSTELVEDIKTKLFPQVITMNAVTDLGTKDVKVSDRTNSQAYLEELRTTLAESSDAFLSDVLSNPDKLDSTTCNKELVAQISRMQICPILFGSAIKGVGVPELTGALETHFTPAKNSSNDQLSAVVFKIERGMRDEKIAYVRIYSGKLQVRSQVELHRASQDMEDATPAKITAMQLFLDGGTVDVMAAHAGDIVKVWGLSDCLIDDYLGEQPANLKNAAHFTRPSLEVVIAPRIINDRPRLHAALQRISEQDPFIEVRQNARDDELSVQLCGEVQKEVIQDTLKRDYDIDVTFSETTIICVERPIGIGEGIESGKRGDPYLGTVGLRIEPGPINSGVRYQRASSVLGTMPPAFFIAIEETVTETLQEGLHGWQVTDCIVMLTHTGFFPRQSHAHATFDKSMSSTAGDFRNMTPLALMAALRQAGTKVYEPMNHFELDVPQLVLAQVMQALVNVEARLDRPPMTNEEVIHLEGLIPARRTFEFERAVPDLTGGEGAFVTEFGEYQAVQGTIPTRERTDNNPLNREEYLRKMAKRA